MLRTRPTYKKPQSAPKKQSKKISDKQNIENCKPVSFNTKGYFSPDQPYNEDYLKAKLQVFKKYRDSNQQLVVLDKKDIHPGAFIQRGIVNPNSNTVKIQPLGMKNINQQKVLNSFVKNYINRKEKKERIDEKKYAQGVYGVLSELRALQSTTTRDFQSCRTSRASKSIMQSRQSTTRQIPSHQELFFQ